MKIVFVGLTNKIGKEPLDDSTATGKVIDEIISVLGDEHDFRKINLVQHAPVDNDGKLRYPTKREISEGITAFHRWEAAKKPDIIVLLGGIVSKSINTDNSIKVQHPAYAIRRGLKQQYITAVVNQINQFTAGIME